MENITLPVSLVEFIPYLSQAASTTKALEPYKRYEGKLRHVFAQDRNSAAAGDPSVNVVPLFAGYEHLVKTRARDLPGESVEQREKYLLPLADLDRKANGTNAIVGSLNEFKTNFNLFSESSLVGLDWSNIVAAGSSVITSLLPVPSPHNENKRALRMYYHEKVRYGSQMKVAF